MEKPLSFKDKIKLFQQGNDDIVRINTIKNNGKIKAFGKKDMISGDIINTSKEMIIHSLKETKNKKKRIYVENFYNLLKKSLFFLVY